MSSVTQRTIGVLMALFVASSCDGIQLTPEVRPGAASAGAGGDALYQRLGGEPGIRAVVTNFVQRTVQDPRINGYFLNSTVSGQRVIDCVTIQVAAATGGPYNYASSGCRDMKSTHLGMKISKQDFDDTAGHLVAALQAGGVSAADIATLVSVVASTERDIVEDPNNNMTVYQRVGRRPAIEAVVVALMVDLFNDPRINAFFAGGNADRLRTCLTRQVCGIDGPCKYGKEVDEPGVSAMNPCKDMLASHRGINSPRAITKADFDVLVGVLVGVLDRAGVPAAEKNAVLGALGPLCKDIVAGGTGC
jgi:hemoglobin